MVELCDMENPLLLSIFESRNAFLQHLQVSVHVVALRAKPTLFGRIQRWEGWTAINKLFKSRQPAFQFLPFFSDAILKGH